MEIAALASAAVSAGTGTANAISAGKANKRGVAYAEKENGLQRDFQLDQWNRQNEYNDPKNMMKRLKDAGINPHYYMGGGAGIQQSQAVPSAGGGAVPNIKPIDFTPIGQAGQTMLQAEMMKAQIDNIKADTANKGKTGTSIDLANGITTLTLENTPTTINLDNQTKGENIELLKVKVDSEKQEITNKITQNAELKEKISNLITTRAYTEQQTANLVASLALVQAQTKTENVKQSHLKSQISLNKAAENLQNEYAKTQSHVRSNLDAQTSERNAQTRNLGKQYSILEEDRQAKNRANFNGERFDYGDRQNAQNTSVDQLQVIKQTYRNLMKDEEFKSLKIEEQEFINMNMTVDAALRPIKEVTQFRTGQQTMQNQTRNSRSMQRSSRSSERATTTTRYDSQGNYSGHTTSRRH